MWFLLNLSVIRKLFVRFTSVAYQIKEFSMEIQIHMRYKPACVCRIVRGFHLGKILFISRFTVFLWHWACIVISFDLLRNGNFKILDCETSDIWLRFVSMFLYLFLIQNGFVPEIQSVLLLYDKFTCLSGFLVKYCFSCI